MDKDKAGIIVKNRFCGLHAIVIGDVMVDEYVTGKVSRISPEAPIPILSYGQTRKIAGGASNVVHNVAMLGCSVAVFGVIGDDADGRWLTGHLQAKGIDTGGLLVETGRPTTVKRRFATKSQQLLRVDMERSDAVTADTQERLYHRLSQMIGQTDAVILSDYQKGVLCSPEFVEKIIRLCNDHHVVVTVDSKSQRIESFQGATFVKPNNLELENAVDVKIVDDGSFDQAGWAYLNRSGAKSLIVTRGHRGISLFEKGRQRRDYPSKAVQVYDVTGAGDTVISTATLGIAGGMELEDSIVLGNIAAGIVISKVGTVPVTAEELAEKLYEP